MMMVQKTQKKATFWVSSPVVPIHVPRATLSLCYYLTSRETKSSKRQKTGSKATRKMQQARKTSDESEAHLKPESEPEPEPASIHTRARHKEVQIAETVTWRGASVQASTLADADERRKNSCVVKVGLCVKICWADMQSKTGRQVLYRSRSREMHAPVSP